MHFDSLIGQDTAKRELTMRLEAFKAGQPMETLLFVAPKGKGKTSLAIALGKAMKEIDAKRNIERKLFEVNCSSIKNLKVFWDSLVIPVLNDRQVTLLLDESHMLPNDVMNCLLTCLNPNENWINTFSYQDMTVTFNLRQQNILFATTEANKMALPLRDRCRRIDLEDYTNDQMVQIVKRYAKNIKFEKGVAEDVASCLRSTPRQAVLISRDIKSYLAPKKTDKFTKDDWKNLRHTLGVLPLGLTRLELRVLQALEKNRDASLTRVAAILQMTPQSVRCDLELFLLKCGLISIDTSGRNLTQAGYEYLKSL